MCDVIGSAENENLFGQMAVPDSEENLPQNTAWDHFELEEKYSGHL